MSDNPANVRRLNTVRLKSSNRYQARWRFDGTTKLLTCYGSTAAQAEDERERRIAAERAGESTVFYGIDKTIAQLGARWLASLEPDVLGRTRLVPCSIDHVLERTTLDHYSALLTKHCGVKVGGMRSSTPAPWGETFGALLVAKVTPQDITRLLEAMRNAGLSIQVRQGVHGRVASMLQYATVIGWLGAGRDGYTTAAHAVPRPTGHSEPRRHLSEDDAHRLIEAAHAAGSRYADAIEVLIRSAMRPGELLGLRWSSVDLEGGVLRITGALKRQRANLGGVSSLVVGTPKSSSSVRPVRIDPAMRKALERQQARQASERDAAGARWDDRLDLVFTAVRGGPTDPPAFARAFRAVADPLGFENLVAHGCRHTAVSIVANRMLEADGRIDWDALADLAGHADSKITRSVYAHLEAGLVDAARLANLERIGSVL
jgi:integrase